MKTFQYTALACALVLALSACKDSSNTDSTATTTASSTQASQPQRAEEQPIAPQNEANKQAAYNKYVGAHNSVAGMFHGSIQGVDALLEAYQAQDLSNGDGKVNKNIGPRLYLNTTMLGNMIRDLQAAQNLPVGGDMAALEAAATKLLDSSQALLKQGEDLNAYFESKKFLDDQYAKVKAENEGFVKQWTQFNQDYAAFSTQLDEAERQERLQNIAAFTKEGKLREAASETVFLEAGAVLKLIGQPEDLKNAEKMAKADEHMQKLDAALTQLKTQNDQINDAESSSFKTTLGYFNQFSGNWRELKANQDASKFNEMVENYNFAVKFH